MARVNARRKNEPGACGYRAYLLGKQVATHPWLTAYPAGPQRRAARKALRAAAREELGAGTGQGTR
jgi:SLT domain-containing protein